MIIENNFTFIGTLTSKPKLTKRDGKPAMARVDIGVGHGFNYNRIPLVAFDYRAENLHDEGDRMAEIYVKGRVESRKRNVKIEVEGEPELRDITINVPSFVVDQFRIISLPEVEDQ